MLYTLGRLQYNTLTRRLRGKGAHHHKLGSGTRARDYEVEDGRGEE
jgi:hypothetical protein